jgi:diadenosine tetraphosphatase ApaH/serine/threonine PP2A family protein phosphatase
VRIAILSDIHANREAFEAALPVARAFGPDETVLLGDLVGYGPDPEHAVETSARLVEDGALCILGNHDQAAVRDRRDMAEHAREAIRWTRGRLSPAHLAFLDALPLTARSGERLYVHASADQPAKWRYVRDADAAAASLAACDAGLIVCGHTHVPALYYMLPGRRPVRFTPADNVPVPLSRLRRHLLVCGSVGQPRDGSPAACVTLVDTDARSVENRRVPYDHDATARRIVAVGLDPWLAMRLTIGR